ncbi:MAG: IS1380 family transposase, partial [Oscillibacter sp.]|nr:IS1380 family transposase [Oscillibacter sp.]
MSTFEAEHSNERILPNGGMALAGAILEQGGFREALNQLDVTGKRSGNQIKDGDLMSVRIGLCRMGRPDFE